MTSIVSNGISYNQVKTFKSFMTPPHDLRPYVGGGSLSLKYKYSHKMLQPYILYSSSSCHADAQYKYVSHISYQGAKTISENITTYIVCRIPLESIAPYLSVSQANTIARIHGVFIPCRSTLSFIISTLIKHQCSNFCYDYVFVFEVVSAIPRDHISKKTSGGVKQKSSREVKRKTSRGVKRKTSGEVKRTKNVNTKWKQTDAF